ncbi:MAG: DUF1801 domain-containing protein [Bacteroidetes bacterium]|nr:DUF1801 domain-containing protein [Bacteroidota bacterium]
MTIHQQIEALIAGQPEPKRADMQALHDRILKALPGIRLWYDSGVDERGKVVANPTIGYGLQVLQYAGGKTKDFFQIGMSGNTTGISVYILGLKDKKYLSDTYGENIGKASVTGYCIKFKKLADIDTEVLLEAILHGVKVTAV